MGVLKRIVRLDSTLSMRLTLSRRDAAVEGPFEIRELGRAEADEITRSLIPGMSCEQIDRVAPGRWRMFAVFDGGQPIHQSIVGYRDRGPLLFMCLTTPRARGRGAFVAAIVHIGAVLGDEGESHLDSSCSGSNLPSVAGHARGGFRVRKRTLRPHVLGVDLRKLARRLLRRG